MSRTSASLLQELEALRGSYGPGIAQRRLDLLRRLETRRLRSARQVGRLHEILAFARAYPDDKAVLDQVEGMLQGFATRVDLQTFREALANSGIAGTDIYYRFYWVIARWLARCWPEQLTIDWPEFENRDRLLDNLDLLLPYTETIGVDSASLSLREWIEHLKGTNETDAAFLIGRFAALEASEAVRERLYEQLDVPLWLAGRVDTPSRTLAHFGRSEVVFQKHSLSRPRPSLKVEIDRPPVAVRRLSRRHGERFIELARSAMLTRSRDLDAFADADPRDVRLYRFERGLEFACLGPRPERRLMLEGRYGFLNLKNGVPIGYGQATGLFGSSEVAYNIFDTFRGAEAARVFARLLAVIRHLFGCDVFAIDPYQLGYGNAEGLASGAWWFYYKLGFRPVDRDVRELVKIELTTLKSEPEHRSSPQTLEELASAYLFYFPSRQRRDVLGRLSLENIGLRLSSYLAERFGSDRESGVRTCAREAADRLRLDGRYRLDRNVRLAWRRWAPLVCLLPDLEDWTRQEKRAVIEVIRAKGGPRESDYVRRFDAHTRLRAALVELANRSAHVTGPRSHRKSPPDAAHAHPNPD